MRRALLLLLPFGLAACSEAEICRTRATRDVRVLDRMIHEEQDTLDRGYRLVEVPNPFIFGTCFGHMDNGIRVAGCYDGDPIYRREEINVEAERAKLASLQEQRARAEAPTQAALAACPPK